MSISIDEKDSEITAGNRKLGRGRLLWNQDKQNVGCIASQYADELASALNSRRPGPSRLEVASRIMAGMSNHQGCNANEIAGLALAWADALIAACAAGEGKP